MTADFRDLLICAKSGDEDSFTELLTMYKPLLMREATIEGIFDEDLFQEHCITFFRCVRSIQVEYVRKKEGPNDHALS